MRGFLFGLGLVAFSSPAWSSIVVDGTKDEDYGAARAIQTVETGFGDAVPPGNTTGSELDAAYAVVHGGRLYLLLTGNLDPNFNRLEVFIDSKSGGENTLTNTPTYDEDNVSQNLGGLTFDTGFLADYHLYARWGPNGAGSFAVDFINRQGGAPAMVPGSTGTSPAAVALHAAGVIASGNVAPNASGTALSKNLYFALDDNNAAGVGGGAPNAAITAAAAAVTTGMEFSIALDDLGSPAPGFLIKIVAAINNGDHNYLSNQVLAGLPVPSGNLGGDGAGGFTGTVSGVDLADFAGTQFFTVQVPDETAIELTLTEYVEGSGNSKALEIHNATGTTIDLDAGDYSVALFFDGSVVPTTIDLTGTLPANGIFVLANSLAAPAILDAADQVSAALSFDGNDGVVLRQGAIAIDSVGQTGDVPPGGQWGTDPRSTTDQTLRREDKACRGDFVSTNVYDPAPEWDGLAVDTVAGLGSHASSCPSCGAGGFDVDLNGDIEPLADGLLILRHLFGFTGTTLVQSALGIGATRTDPAAITLYLMCLESWLINPDANAQADPLTDGLLLLRDFFGFSGTTLTSGAVGPGCKRCDAAAIEAFIASRPVP